MLCKSNHLKQSKCSVSPRKVLKSKATHAIKCPKPCVISIMQLEFTNEVEVANYSHSHTLTMTMSSILKLSPSPTSPTLIGLLVMFV